jgi:hypothetical protein
VGLWTTAYRAATSRVREAEPLTRLIASAAISLRLKTCMVEPARRGIETGELGIDRCHLDCNAGAVVGHAGADPVDPEPALGDVLAAGEEDVAARRVTHGAPRDGGAEAATIDRGGKRKGGGHDPAAAVENDDRGLRVRQQHAVEVARRRLVDRAAEDHV